MARKRKIAIEKTVMDSMLDYLEIEQGANIDELKKKAGLKKILKQITDSYDRQIIEDMVKKMKDQIDNELESDNGDDFLNEENMFKPGDGFTDKPSEWNQSDWDQFSSDEFNPEIEKFLAWLSSVLYSGDHKIEISKTDNKTNILLIKLDKNGRK